MEVRQDAVENKVHCLYCDKVCLFQQDKVSPNSTHITATEFRCQGPSAIRNIWLHYETKESQRGNVLLSRLNFVSSTGKVLLSKVQQLVCSLLQFH